MSLLGIGKHLMGKIEAVKILLNLYYLLGSIQSIVFSYFIKNIHFYKSGSCVD